MPSRQTLYPGRQMGRLGDRSGAYGYRALGAPFLNSIYPDSRVPGAAYASTDIYSYNAQRVNLDYLGNAYLLPKHYNCPEGLSYFQNEFAAQGVDWTDTSIWTEANGGSLSKASATELALSSLGAGSGSGRVVSPLLFSGVDLEGRSTGAVVLVKATSESDVGNDVVAEIVCVGATNSQSVTITLTAEYQPIYTGTMVGTSGDTGLYLRFYGAVTNTANNCTVSLPGIIEWRTGQDTSKPPMPQDIKCFVPVGPELFVSPTTGTGWTDNGGGTFTGATASGDLTVASKSVQGQIYCTSLTVDSVSAGSVNVDAGTTNGTTRSTAATFYENIAGGAGTSLAVETPSDFTGVLSGVSFRESANGFYASEYTPANTVSSGVITRGTGTLLHPWHWERIGYSVPLKVKDQYDPWEASTAYGAGVRVIPTTKNGWYFISSGGTSDSAEPDWSTVTAPGDTVTDNDITWTAGYYTNLGVPIEPATTQDMATAAVLATGGSASTYPTNWGELADANTIASVVGEGVSPVHPSARYVDVRINNASGGNATAQIHLYTTSTTGATQGDDVTVSAWLDVISGTVTGTAGLGIDERSAADANLAVTVGSVTPSTTLNRHFATVQVANASTDRYRPVITFTDVTDTSDFTIRITLPNSVQQSYPSSVILGQETRTSQVGALRYDISNFNVANTQIRADVSLGVAQSAIGAAHNVWSVDASSATTGVHFQSDGDLAISDGTNTAVVTDWSETADTVVRTAANMISASDDLDLDVYTPTSSPTGADASYADAMGTPDALTIGATTLTYPMHIHRLNSVPNGGETSVTLTSDSERYAQ